MKKLIFLVLLWPCVALAQPLSEGTATFAAADSTTSIGAAYASALDPVNGTKVVILDNQTNGDVWVSMDAGTNDHFHLQSGDVLSLSLIEQGLSQAAAIHLKDGTSASSSGTFYIYTYK